MGETMSKRLRSELEMEERSFFNPYPDCRGNGAAAASAPANSSGAGPHDQQQQQQEAADCFDSNGKELYHHTAPGLHQNISLKYILETLKLLIEPTTISINMVFLVGAKRCSAPDEQFQLSPAFIKRIQHKIKDLLIQMEEGLKTADPHDCCAYTGWTGIALLYLQCFRVTQESVHLQRSLYYVKRTLRNLNGRRVTFLCGDAGPLAVGAVVHHKLKNEIESQECVTKLLQLQRTVICLDSDIPDELLYGRAGYLYALLYVNVEIGQDTIPFPVIQEVVNAIIESGKNLSKEERKTERCPLLYQWHKKQYVGAAHGLAGIYYMLMQAGSKLDQETLTELVKPSVDYVRHKKFRSGNYPSSLSNETDRLVHWCHGAPGVIHMLIQSHKTFKEEKYLRDAMECSDVIWQRGLLRKGYGICHGTAGNGYAFLSLYKLTRDKKYLYRACKFAEWCLDYGTHGCRIPDRPYSLFEGMAGAIHFLSDMLNPEASRFPALEL